VGLAQDGLDGALVVLDGRHDDFVPLEQIQGGGLILSVVGGLDSGLALLDPDLLILEGGEDGVEDAGLLKLLLAVLGQGFQLSKFAMDLGHLFLDGG